MRRIMPIKLLRRCAVDFSDLCPIAFQTAHDAEKVLYDDHYAFAALVTAMVRIVV